MYVFANYARPCIYAAHRFSTSDQINVKNGHSLVAKWVYQTDAPGDGCHYRKLQPDTQTSFRRIDPRRDRRVNRLSLIYHGNWEENSAVQFSAPKGAPPVRKFFLGWKT